MQKSFNHEGHKGTRRKSVRFFGRTEPFPPLHERDARAYMGACTYVTFLGLATEAITEMARTPATATRATGVGISR